MIAKDTTFKPPTFAKSKGEVLFHLAQVVAYMAHEQKDYEEVKATDKDLANKHIWLDVRVLRDFVGQQVEVETSPVMSEFRKKEIWKLLTKAVDEKYHADQDHE